MYKQVSILVIALTLRGLMGYSEALKNIKSYQLAGSDAMINGGSYQVASTEDILKVQNRIKKEVGKKGVSESKLKTSLVLNDFGTSSYVSDDFVNSTGSYEAGLSEATGGGSVSTYMEVPPTAIATLRILVIMFRTKLQLPLQLIIMVQV